MQGGQNLVYVSPQLLQIIEGSYLRVLLSKKFWLETTFQYMSNYARSVCRDVLH